MTSLQVAALRARALRGGRRTLRAASVPLITVIQPLAGIIGLRLSYSWSTPTTLEVIENYTRGMVLFGRSGARWVKFEWRSFPMRAIITKDTAKVPRRLRGIQRHGGMEVRFDQDFEAIIRGCREGRAGWMWITPELIDVYRELFSRGFVSTVGTYRAGQLVGGLWGIGIGGAFGLMSMFHREDHAGSLALAALVDTVLSEGRWSVVDCGKMTANFGRYGAVEIRAEHLCELLRNSLGQTSGLLFLGLRRCGCPAEECHVPAVRYLLRCQRETQMIPPCPVDVSLADKKAFLAEIFLHAFPARSIFWPDASDNPVQPDIMETMINHHRRGK